MGIKLSLDLTERFSFLKETSKMSKDFSVFIHSIKMSYEKGNDNNENDTCLIDI